MMSGLTVCKSLFLGVMVLFLAACGGGSSSVAPIATVSTNAPTAPDPALIPPDTIITITFNASMDPTSLVLGGDLAGESNGGIWSTTNATNDTLTLSPVSTWAVRTGSQLTIDAKDTGGRPARTVDLAYDIYQGILYYVSYATGNDGNAGTNPLTAFKNIDYAVNNISPSATILVAGGTYPVSYTVSADTRIWLRPDISLYGGYSSDFSTRDPALYPSTIRDNTGAVPGTATNPNFAIIADNTYTQANYDTDITNTTLVDGFTIFGMVSVVANVTGDYTTAIRVHNGAAPVFANNTIYGGLGVLESIGIYTNGSSPTIYNNNIIGSYSGSNISYGVYATNASPHIMNNMISGGDFIPNSTGYYLINGAGVLRNNTIYSGSGTLTATAVALVGYNTATNPNIDNNIIFSDAGFSCITETVPTGSGSATPASLRNNDLFNCTVLYSDYENGCGGISSCTNVAQVNALGDIPSVGTNISVDPLFANIGGTDTRIGTVDDNDWHFTPPSLTTIGSPVSVTAGGLNGIDEGWSFITDKDNVVRPASGHPWSIGAYEP